MAVEWAGSWAQDVQTEAAAKARTAAKSSGLSGGGSLMMQLAVALGEIADKFVKRVLDKAKELDAAAEAKANNPKGPSSENVLTAEMQALTQIMKSFIEAMNTVIKTMGEGNSSVARKQ